MPDVMNVGMGDLCVAKGPALYQCIGLGSCIGFTAFDPRAEVSGCVHIMLPEHFKGKPVDKVGKYADLAIDELIAQMAALGANPRLLRCAYAGGAQVFKFGEQTSNNLQIGSRNAEMVQQMTRKLGLRPHATDVGGTMGRTLNFDAVSGIVKVRTLHQEERILAELNLMSARAA
ncbi:MAG: hypothetical protein JNM85_01540 [Chthonomonas sp.]|nr:hypothetical protein [Chthonomonas sp.]